MSIRENKRRELFSQFYPNSAITEAFRMLRANISFASADRAYKMILVTSPAPGDGKSTVVSNLGVVISHSGRRVLILDCDLRQPVMHKYFNVDNQRGLTNLLTLDMDISEALVKTEVEGLWLIPSGPIPPNPSELLESSKMKAFLKKVSSDYDVVLLDTPPVLAVADARVLVSMMDGVILVLKASESHIGMAREARNLLMNANARHIGIVLNQARQPGSGYYNNYYGAKKQPVE